MDSSEPGELTLILFDIELSHLGLEASIYSIDVLFFAIIDILTIILDNIKYQFKLHSIYSTFSSITKRIKKIVSHLFCDILRHMILILVLIRFLIFLHKQLTYINPLFLGYQHRSALGGYMYLINIFILLNLRFIHS